MSARAFTYTAAFGRVPEGAYVVDECGIHIIDGKVVRSATPVPTTDPSAEGTRAPGMVEHAAADKG